jgi:hypothetical protein
MHQYADDMQLYLAFDLDKQEEAMARMEACVSDIRICMRQNKLKLNEDKTELLMYVCMSLFTFFEEHYNKTYYMLLKLH